MDTFSLSDGEFGITFFAPVRGAEGWLDYFSVQISEPGLSASVVVENSRFIQGPQTFFAELAASWRGWTGEKTWHALEAEIDLIATSDSQGHVKITASLRPDRNSDKWRASSYVNVDAGQLDSIAYRASKFFASEP